MVVSKLLLSGSTICSSHFTMKDTLLSAPANYVLCASTRNDDLGRSEYGRQAATATSATEIPDKLLLQRANDDST